MLNPSSTRRRPSRSLGTVTTKTTPHTPGRDIVIVGAGTAGSVPAARLTEQPDVRVHVADQASAIYTPVP